MNKIERINTVLKGDGDNLDRLPFSLWYHFGLQHSTPEQLANAHLSFFHSYDLDFLKVMNDYAYPMSDNQGKFLEDKEMFDISELSDWKRLKVLSGDEAGFGKQLKALEVIAKELKGNAYFVETIFSPWTIARKLSDKETLLKLKNKEPELLLDIMYKIAQSLANYAFEAVSRGAAGIFLSLSAASQHLMTYLEYEKFCRPFDLMVLNRVKEKTNFNILHIHGEKIFFDELIDYPVQAINWSHRHTSPSLKDASIKYKRVFLGGIDEKLFAHNKINHIEEEIKETINSIGKSRLIITPGCSIESDSASKLIYAAKRAIIKYSS
jgi:uroporphyrinogen decarboxylase